MRLQLIAPQTPAFAAFVRELDAVGLPTGDLLAEGGRYFALGETEQEARGFVGLVAFGEDALVRSLVVPRQGRGAGLGGEMLAQVTALAQADGLRRLWLLTTDAEAYFARHGFAAVPRADAPAAIAGSQQASALCPSSAILMCKTPA